MKGKGLLKRATGFREMGVIAALILLFVIFALSSDVFLSGDNLLNVTRQIAINGLLAIAMTFVIITGGIDLSVGAIIAFSGIVTTSAIVDYNVSIGVAIVLGVLAGCITGVVNGLLISFLNMPAFITTMGTMTMLRGFCFIYTQGYPIYNLPDEFKLIGQGYLGVIPVATIILLVVAVLAYIVLRKTIFGRHIYAIGGNPEAARFAGIKVKTVNMMVYVISGLICGLAAVVQAARIGSGMPGIGEGFELDAIAAVVIGGAAMTGGSGGILGTILGAIILGVLDNGLGLLDVDSYVMDVISGLVVILAVLIDQLRTIMAKRAQVKNTKLALNAEKK